RQAMPEAGDAGWVKVKDFPMPVADDVIVLNGNGAWATTFDVPQVEGPLRFVIEQGELISTNPGPRTTVSNGRDGGGLIGSVVGSVLGGNRGTLLEPVAERLIHQDVVPYPFVS